MTLPGNQRVDLTDLSQAIWTKSNFRSRRTTSLIGTGSVFVFSAYLYWTSFKVSLDGRFWTSGLGWGLFGAVLDVAGAVLLLMSNQTDRPPATGISVGQSGVTVEYSFRGPVHLDWNDPGFDMVVGQPAPFEPYPSLAFYAKLKSKGSSQRLFLTQEAGDLILSGAKSVGMRMEEVPDGDSVSGNGTRIRSPVLPR